MKTKPLPKLSNSSALANATAEDHDKTQVIAQPWDEVTQTSAGLLLEEVTQTSADITQTTAEPQESTAEIAHSPAEIMENFAISLWKKVRINLDDLFIKRENRSWRVRCYEQVVFTNEGGKKVATGILTDLSEKSGGFIIEWVYLNLNDVLYLEFVKSDRFDLTHVKVTVKRIQPWGARLKIGVEFSDPTSVFKERLAKFLGEWRTDKAGFDDLETT